MMFLVTAVLCSCSASRKGSSIAAPEGMSRELVAAGTNVEALSASDACKIATRVAGSYTPWQEVSLDGKLQMDALPLSPSVKLYMQKNELIIISLRVPLMGELGRVEITADSLLMVNKLKRVYAAESTVKYLGRVGADISNLQDLFLGRVFLLNAGTLSAATAPLVDVSAGAGDTWIVTPRQGIPEAEYGFTLYADGKMLMACAFTPDGQYYASAEYDYKDKSRLMDMQFKSGQKGLEFALSFNNPDYSPNKLDRVTINKKWKKVDVSQWLKSLS